MLLALAQWLAQDVRFFSVFNYITLRTVLAAMTALVISFLVGPAMIRKLAAYKIGQSVRSDGPQTHLVKAGTPTMGGALILTSIAITTLLWGDLHNHYVWVVLLTTLGFGVIGWVDDYRKVVHRNPKGSVGKGQDGLAVHHRAAGRLLSVGCRHPARAHRTHRAVPEILRVPARRIPVHRADLSGHRRHQQRGESDRWPGRPGHHADGDGKQRAGDIRLRGGQCGVLEISRHSLYPRCGRTGGVLRRDRRRRSGLPVVQRLSRPKCSWAMSARWRSVRRWARWR